MKRTLLVCLFFVFGFLSTKVWAQDKSSKWTVEDIINQESASGLEFSPDGNSIVWVKRHPDKKKDKYVSDLYLTRLDIKEDGKFKTIQLTRGDESDSNPIFSNDGKIIYFLSSRDKGKKIWALSVYGGEPYEVHSFDTNIGNLKRLGNNQLIFESNEGKSLYEQQAEEEHDNTIVVEDMAHFKASRLYSYDLKTKNVKRLTDNEFPVGEFAVSKDGNYLMTSQILSPDYGADANPKPKYYLWNVKDGSKEEILKGDYQTPGNFNFTEDNQGFYFESVKSSDPKWNGAGITLLHYYNISSGDVKDVPLDWSRGMGYGMNVIGGDVLVQLANDATNKLAYLQKTKNGWNKKEVDAGKMSGHVYVMAVGKDDEKLAYAYSTASMLPQYRLADLKTGRNVSIPEGDEFIHLNSYLDKKPKAKSKIVTWKGAMGDEVTGILYYPENYKQGKSYPLVVSIHGGPSGVDTDEWSESWAYFPNIYTQKGAFVLKPNYHGSSNHGLKFEESIKGHYYEYELPDIVAGIDTLVQKGMVDPDSMGVKGWSNGAILTTKLIVEHPNMFKVAAPGAGDVNWTSDYGTCQFGVSFDQSYFGGAPWDDTNGQIFNEAYVLKSPLFQMEKVKTPTIIFQGSIDRKVPRDQSWEYYRALQQIGQAPVRFLWFPDQPHGLQKITHQTRKMKEEIKWFDKYLFGTYEPDNETFKKDSPLGRLLKLDEAKTDEGLYGVGKDGALIPETVSIKKDSIAVGRFEVTNAQFAAFDSSYSYPEVKANYPVTGITAEEAKEYAQWLSDKTGETYRLPNEKEAEAWQKQARKTANKENTLNYWAGYDLTIDEVPELKEKLAKVGHPLLKEVGSFKGIEIGGALIYDLGGNAAEYQSNGKTYGYSAVGFVDERAEVQPSPQAYIGFRIVKE